MVLSGPVSIVRDTSAADGEPNDTQAIAMIWIPGWLINFVTFPGVVLRTAAYRLFCDLMKVPVYEISYWKGNVVHGPITALGAALVIALAPLFVNSVLCSVLTLPAVIPIMFLENSTRPVFLDLFFWCGISIGMHALPPKQSIDQFINEVGAFSSPGFLLYVAKGVAIVMGIIGFLKRLWIDLIYALLVSAALPWLLIKLVQVPA